VRVAHVTDLHVQRFGEREESLLARLAAERPDLIAITGDSVSVGTEQAALERLLSGMRAPLGVVAVHGNWDHWAPTVDLPALYAASRIRLLVNASIHVGHGLWIAGIDDDLGGTPDVDAALAGIPAGAWTLALAHCPIQLDSLAGRVPMVLSGHTHGGQIRLPGLPALWLPRGTARRVEGWFECDGTRQYVSRGIGAVGLPLRLFCPPELPVFELG
jgi:predicted MPP superfamily phosphohydrolase